MFCQMIPTVVRSRGPGMNRGAWAPQPERTRQRGSGLALLELGCAASFFKLLLDVFRLVLAGAFLDGSGSPIDDSFGFLEAQARDRAYHLDHVDLLFTG